MIEPNVGSPKTTCDGKEVCFLGYASHFLGLINLAFLAFTPMSSRNEAQAAQSSRRSIEQLVQLQTPQQNYEYVARLEKLLPPTICPVCAKSFKTIQGRNAHLSMSQDCMWYRKGKARATISSELSFSTAEEIQPTRRLASSSSQKGNSRNRRSIPDILTNTSFEELSQEESAESQPEGAAQGWGPEYALDQFEINICSIEREDEDDEGDILEGIDADVWETIMDDITPIRLDLRDSMQMDIDDQEEEGSSSFRRLMLGRTLQDSEDDWTEEEVDKKYRAGEVKAMQSKLEKEWKKRFGMNVDRETLDPFSSRLDWEVGNWAIRDSASNSAFDRLLAIPEVSHIFRLFTALTALIIIYQVRERLGLSYRNMRELHQKVDSLPDRVGTWTEKTLFYPDKPDDTYIV